MASESASILRTVGKSHSNRSNTIKASSCIDSPLCIVIAIARAGFKGRTSLIYCLNYTHDGLKGDPFRLHDRKGLYIWQNNAIRLQRIRNGSVLKYLKSGSKFLYQENTNEVKERILEDSKLAIASCVYQGITKACPGACILDKGVCWRGTGPLPRRNFLVTMKKIAFISDERITFGTTNGEYVDLKLNCRENLTLSVSNTGLRMLGPVNDQNSCGDAVALISFCKPIKTLDGITVHRGVCEGLILRYKPTVISIDNEPVHIQDGDGKYILLPTGRVKFDSGSDVGALISNKLVENLHLGLSRHKKVCINLAGGNYMQCNRVKKTKLKIRGSEFQVDALAGDPAPGCDLLIGMDIIKQFYLANYSLGE